MTECSFLGESIHLDTLWVNVMCFYINHRCRWRNSSYREHASWVVLIIYLKITVFKCKTTVNSSAVNFSLKYKQVSGYGFAVIVSKSFKYTEPWENSDFWKVKIKYNFSVYFTPLTECYFSMQSDFAIWLNRCIVENTSHIFGPEFQRNLVICCIAFGQYAIYGRCIQVLLGSYKS